MFKGHYRNLYYIVRVLLCMSLGVKLNRFFLEKYLRKLFFYVYEQNYIFTSRFIFENMNNEEKR